MGDFLDIYNIIFLVLAVAIFFRLRSVLGRRTGSERPPFDPYSSRDADSDSDAGSNDNVVSIGGKPDDEDRDATHQDQKLAKLAPEGSALNEALRSIISADRSFDPQHFVQGAKAAYEMIVTAFAEGDRKSLKGLLSREVYEGFVSAIDGREARGETVESTFVGIDKAEIVEATLKKSIAQVTVRFRSQLISATRNEDGAIIEGDPNQVTEVTDIWTFSRDTSTQDPNWKLVATEAAE
ncbi:Tim44/TimA family putative adaptor protein [Breoghania sp. L-A4]|uniref:Tim44/TimA family putative adaptor protein n=1 Tax=Breoghania sp. L-A4 TaxID=2304600 RepID=UPI000E35A3D7|nr:Tim44/TimA family putative adaptor protein [Breoghania sp. L-A4]AXS38927.1 calcium-binding protein [Breoghania sp. L-A4]